MLPRFKLTELTCSNHGTAYKRPRCMAKRSAHGSVGGWRRGTDRPLKVSSSSIKSSRAQCSRHEATDMSAIQKALTSDAPVAHMTLELLCGFCCLQDTCRHKQLHELPTAKPKKHEESFIGLSALASGDCRCRQRGSRSDAKCMARWPEAPVHPMRWSWHRP